MNPTAQVRADRDAIRLLTALYLSPGDGMDIEEPRLRRAKVLDNARRHLAARLPDKKGTGRGRSRATRAPAD